ncbi:MAG: PqqD family protein [Bradymonadia bacterium]
MSDLTTLYSPSIKISARIVDGQLIILRPGNDELLRFNAVASYVWSVIEKEPASLEALVKMIVEEFEVEADTARADLEAFLSEMITQDLVVSGPRKES